MRFTLPYITIPTVLVCLTCHCQQAEADPVDGQEIESNVEPEVGRSVIEVFKCKGSMQEVYSTQLELGHYGG